MERRSNNAFAVWVTGLPASGKSTLVASLTAQLAERGIDVAVLESDVLRQIFTPHPRYDDEERDAFYRQIAFVGSLLTEHGVPVIFDATANRRIYRERGRQQIPRFLEVLVDCPLEVCMARDPKGIYGRAREAGLDTVPGLHVAYEPPENPDVLVNGCHEAPDVAASRVVAKLEEKSYIHPSASLLSS